MKGETQKFCGIRTHRHGLKNTQKPNSIKHFRKQIKAQLSTMVLFLFLGFFPLISSSHTHTHPPTKAPKQWFQLLNIQRIAVSYLP